MDEEEWFVTNGDWRMGPLTIDDLVEVLGREHEPGTVLVWKTGLETWTRPELVADLTAPAARPRTGLAVPPPVGAPVATLARARGAEGAQAPWFRVGTAKFLLMCVVTFGGYQIYWFYQQWRHVQRRGEVVHPALRTLFTGIFCYALFRRVAEDALARGVATVPHRSRPRWRSCCCRSPGSCRRRGRRCRCCRWCRCSWCSGRRLRRRSRPCRPPIRIRG
jgi:hypothetical protein